MDHEIAQMQVRQLDVLQDNAVVIAEIDRGIVAAFHCMEQRSPLTGLRLGQKRL